MNINKTILKQYNALDHLMILASESQKQNISSELITHIYIAASNWAIELLEWDESELKKQLKDKFIKDNGEYFIKTLHELKKMREEILCQDQEKND